MLQRTEFCESRCNNFIGDEDVLKQDEEHRRWEPETKVETRDSPTETYFVISSSCHNTNDGNNIDTNPNNEGIINTNNSNEFLPKTSKSSNNSDDEEKNKNETEAKQSQVNMIDCLQAIYDVMNNRKDWNKKLLALAQKVRKPGVEEKLRRKIGKYLESVPSPFSEFDEDGKEFRKKLPDHFIDYLKKIFDAQYAVDKLLKNAEVEPMNNEPDLTEAIKSVIKPWIKTIPMKKIDFLNRPIKKDDLVHTIVQRLEPFIRHHPTSKTDHKYLLSTYIIDILNEMPVNVVPEIKSEFLHIVCENLVKKLLFIEFNEYKVQKEKRKWDANNKDDTKIRTDKRKVKVQQIKVIVKKNLIELLTKIGKVISKHRVAVMEIEIIGILVDYLGITSNIDHEVRKEVKATLKSTGRLPEYHAQYCTNKIINDYKDVFKNEAHRFNNYCKTDTYLFQCLQDDIMSTKDTCTRKTTELYEPELRSYRKQVTEQIDRWLQKFDDHIPLVGQRSFREMAVSDLATDIVSRQKYLNKQSIESSDSRELHRLQFNIYQWLRKLVGEDMMEAIHNVPDLMNKIQSVPKPSITKLLLTNESEVNISTRLLFEQLCDAIFVWCDKLPNKLYNKHDFTDKKEYARQLAENIKKIVENGHTSDDIVIPEIQSWIKTTFKTQPNLSQIENLKFEVKKILCRVNSNGIEVQNCASLQAEATTSNTEHKAINISKHTETNIEKVGYFNKLTTEIDRWLAIILPNIKEGELKRIAIADLVEDIIDRHKYLQKNPANRGSYWDELEYLKYQIYKWMHNLAGDESSKIIDRASDLMQKISNITKIQVADKNLLIDKNKAVQNKFDHNINNCNRKSDLQTQDAVKNDSLESGTIFEPTFNQQHNSECCSKNCVISKTLKNQLDHKLETDKINAHLSINGRCLDCISQIDERSKVNEENLGSTSKDIPYRSPPAKIKNKPEDRAPVRLSNPSGYVAGPMAYKTSSSGFNTAPMTSKMSYGSAPGYVAGPIAYKASQKSLSGVVAEPITSNVSQSSRPEFVAVPITHKTSQSSSSGYVVGSIVNKMSNFSPKSSQQVQVFVSDIKAGLVNSDTKRNSKNISEEAENFQPAPAYSNDFPIGGQIMPNLTQTFEQYDEIFRNKVTELPIDEPTEEQKSLGEIARKAVYNGIWKTYVTLKSDPNIENDYSLFEQMLEDRLDLLLDCLPQTPNLKSMRHQWKLQVASSVIKMLKQVHSSTDRPSFREQLAEKFSRKFIKSRDQQISDRIQQVFVTNAADAFIVYSRYQAEDPIKANIYRQRLMKRLEELVEHTKRVHNVEFRHVDTNQLLLEAFKILGEVPLPNNEELKEEANEIMYLDEIESWYNVLPVKPIRSVLDDILRNRMREMLARRLLALEKELGPSHKSLDERIRHEVSVFLENNAELDEKEDLNINFMAEELANRLRNMNLQVPTYNAFQRGNIANSTLIQPYQVPDLTPLIGGRLSERNLRRNVNNTVHQAIQYEPYTNLVPPNNQFNTVHNTEYMAPAFVQDQENDQENQVRRPPVFPFNNFDTEQTRMPIAPNMLLNRLNTMQTPRPFSNNQSQQINDDAVNQQQIQSHYNYLTQQESQSNYSRVNYETKALRHDGDCCRCFPQLRRGLYCLRPCPYYRRGGF